MEIRYCEVDMVQIGNRLRSLDPDKVASLAESMDAIGLQQPISVWSDSIDTLELVAGLHRLEAARKLGWEDIDCIVVNLDDLDRQLWEIDENLCRSDLTDLQRAQHTAMRAEVIAARAEIDRKKELSAKSAHKSPAHRPSKGQEKFVADTAAKTGRSVRSVKQDKARGEKIAEDVQKDIEGTAIADSGVQLDALAAATPWDQREAVKAVNLGDAKDVRDVLPEAKGKRGKSRRTSWEIRIDNFDRATRFISTACSCLPQFDIPNLDGKRRSQTMADLRVAAKHIEEFIKNIQDAEEVNETELARLNKSRPGC